MKIAFGDFSAWDIHADSVASAPLGGSQSAACYLAQALAHLGHEVLLIGLSSAPGVHAGVHCLSWNTTPVESLRLLRLDVFICVLGAGNGALLRRSLDPATRLVFWTQHRCDQAAVQTLRDPGERGSYDAVVLVSDWQREEFLTHFGLDPRRTAVLRNAIAPAFQKVFPHGVSIAAQKPQPPILAYTSTPFRGLDVLIEAFPVIRAAVPGTRLRVFSSMQVYRLPPEADEAQFGALYRRCRETAGVEYVGSVSQPVLAAELRAVTALAYPNTFPETSCIAVLEALASGCRVITSALGALPETAAGFARLIAVERRREEYLPDFIAETIRVLEESRQPGPELERRLRQQVDHFTTQAIWSRRAAEWETWLAALVG